jgi:hypothetical protein
MSISKIVSLIVAVLAFVGLIAGVFGWEPSADIVAPVAFLALFRSGMLDLLKRDEE